jgi:CDP-diacylglycerol--serine O-phosphatidyltransferase
MKKDSVAVFLVTVVVTLANAICGFIVVFFLTKFILLRNTPGIFAENYLTLAWMLLVLAGGFDFLDGVIARLTGTTGEFGKELDSLADAVSWGIVPALMIALLNSFGTHPYWEKFSWFCAIFYLSCVLLRLARFNVESSPQQKYHFEFRGLPSPGAAAIIVAMLVLFLGLRDGNILFTRILWGLFSKNSIIQFSDYLFAPLPFMGLVLGFLMVSNIKFFHIDAMLFLFKGKAPFLYLIYISVAFLLIVLFREMALVLFAICFLMGGPISYFYDLLTRKSKKSGKPA